MQVDLSYPMEFNTLAYKRVKINSKSVLKIFNAEISDLRKIYKQPSFQDITMQTRP
jgi:hypothetical protein